MDVITTGLRDLRALFLKNGHDIRLVGGVVRDLLLGETPKDVDLCTDATPDEMLELLQRNAIRHIPTGLQHGTITVVLDSVYEITSLRTESNHDGRWATVAYSRDWVLDLFRRDLTINAMSMTFDGDLIDPFGGRADLEARRVRFVGDADERVRQDYLRMLRLIRFHARFAGDAPFDAGAEAALIRNAAGLTGISRERVWSEMRRIIAGPAAEAMLKALHWTGLTHHMGFRIRPFGNFRTARIQSRCPVALMAAYLGDQDSVEALAKSWKWSSAERQRAVFVAKNLGQPADLAHLIARVARDRQDRDLVLAFAEASNSPDTGRFAVWSEPKFPITGDDLLARGLSGVQVGAALRRLRAVWAVSGYTLGRDGLLVEL